MLKIIYLLTLLWWAEARSPTDVERNQIVEMLTTSREQVDPPARNMMLMEYSDDLENLAQKWLKNCSGQLVNETIHPEYKE
uniref:SCP domain-containing protein n=1 Tax=Mesocestoides corti TaxID=53468 RepID=A0A5K3FU64_MESCO